MGMFDWLPWVGDDDDEEITPEQLFINHFSDFGTLLKDEKGKPTLTYEEAIKLFKNSTDKRTIQFLYSN
jgi:hypothetical protein